MNRVHIRTLTCKRCEHVWVPRKPIVYLCPACKSPLWDKPRTLGKPVKR